MKGYSKMRSVSKKKTRSMDFTSDLPSSPKESNENTTPNYIISNNIGLPVHHQYRDFEPLKPEEEEVAKTTKHPHHHDNKVVVEDEGANDGAHGSSPAGLERQGSKRRRGGLESRVKRVLSMRRSSSVSERYCRIYDQHFPLESAIHEDDDSEANNHNNNGMKKNKKRGIFKTCKRLLGF